MKLPCAFGPFVLERRLGAGGMGEIFLARFGDQERACVVKMLRPELAGRPLASKRFVAEARTSALLAHEALPTVLDVGVVDGNAYIAIERVLGHDLLEIHRRVLRDGEAPMTEGVARRVFIELLDVLAYVHRAVDPRTGAALEVVHRDVSLQNIMLAHDGTLKLIDFGIARSSVNAGLTRAGQQLGKIRYMAPEQARGETVDDRADVFAAAVVVAEMVGAARFYGSTPTSQLWVDIAAGKLPAPNLSTVSTAFADAIRSGLSPKRHDRPRADALAAMVRASGPPAEREEVRSLLHRLFPKGVDDRERSASGTAIMTAGGADGATLRRAAAAVTASHVTGDDGDDDGIDGDGGIDDGSIDDDGIEGDDVSRVGLAEVTAVNGVDGTLTGITDRPTAQLTQTLALRRSPWALGVLAAGLVFAFAAVVLAVESAPQKRAASESAAKESAHAASAVIVEATQGASAHEASAQEASAHEASAQETSASSGADDVGEAHDPIAHDAPAHDASAPEASAADASARAALPEPTRARAKVRRAPREAPLFGELVRQLRKCTKTTTCAAPAIARTEDMSTLSVDELRVLEGDVARCVQRCPR